jgi:hypothetical protein
MFSALTFVSDQLKPKAELGLMRSDSTNVWTTQYSITGNHPHTCTTGLTRPTTSVKLMPTDFRVSQKKEEVEITKATPNVRPPTEV